MPVVTLAVTTGGMLAMAQPASSAREEPAANTEETFTTIIVEETLMDKNGRVKSQSSEVVYDEASTLSAPQGVALADGGQVALLASGSEGSSTANGCKTATVRKVERSTLGTLLYTYKTWTSWCWIRSSSFIYQVSNDWDYINDDMCWSWQGQVNKDMNFYNWSGGPQSGYLHRRKGHVQGGCLFANNKYPENYIRAHSNGTWTWDTNG